MPHPLVQRLTTLSEQLTAEHSQREQIENTDEYAALTRSIEELQDQQQALLSHVPDSLPDYEDAKHDMIAYMQEHDTHKVDNVAAKLRERKEVNSARVLEVIGGDLDLYVSISSVTQVSLKSFAKESQDLKKELLACIETTAKEIVDIDLLPAE